MSDRRHDVSGARCWCLAERARVIEPAAAARALQVLTDLYVTDPEPASIRVTEIPPTDVDRALMVDGRATTYVRIEYDYARGSQQIPDHGIVEVPLAVWNAGT